MRLPNGFGSVSKLSGKRRKPYMVRNSKGVILGYVKTRTEGIEKLVEYNQDPYDIDTRKITLKELWELFIQSKKYTNFAKGTKANMNTQFNKSKTLHNIPYRTIKILHMQQHVDGAGTPASQKLMRSYFKNLDSYAKKIDITNSMYSDHIITDEYVPNKRETFTEQQIANLWTRTDEKYVRHALCLIYTGFRNFEYVSLNLEQVNLKDMYFKAGSKTNAGKDRIVPIHSKIQPFIIDMVNKTDNYLLPELQRYKKPENEFRKLFKAATNKIPHETRHTFITRLYNKKVNRLIINALAGHENNDVGADVYTHLEIKELRSAIEKLD